ncbi:MAG TPA: glycosyltransferase family 87 protein [Chloroflexota bacterium]|nr:glycosyltransferase family 87 protein [Chloroflexota bacterium]
MGRLIPLLARWEAIDRRALPARFPRRLGLVLGCLLLLIVAGAVIRDIVYLRSQPGLIPNDDVFAYECYARAFWQGAHALQDAPLMHFCGDPRWRFWTAPPVAFHTLPREYPAPALVVFSLPLLWPFAAYPITYMALLGLLVLGVTGYFIKRRLLLSAAAFALYVGIGGWATALERFDLAPGVLVVAALILAERSRFTRAYLMLAAAAVLKVYPGFVAAVLAARQWRQDGTPPRRELAGFVLASLAAALPFAILNPLGFLGPLNYDGMRPPQIESIPGSLLWLSGKLGVPVRVKLTYHSVNVVGQMAEPVSWLATGLFIAGVVLVCRRAWRGTIGLPRLCVLVLLVMLSTSKILSPQYLLWLFPVAAYAEGLRARWLLVAGLTLMIFPYGYRLDPSLVRLPDHPLFMTGILARNAVLVVLTLTYLLRPEHAQAAGPARIRPALAGEHGIDPQDEGVPRKSIAVGGLTQE